MEAIAKIMITEKRSNAFINWFNTQADNFDNARFWWMSFYIIIQSCIGAFAAAIILQSNAPVWMLCTSAATAMGSNAVFIAQGDKKLCMAVFYLSLIVNAIFILINL